MGKIIALTPYLRHVAGLAFYTCFFINVLLLSQAQANRDPLKNANEIHEYALENGLKLLVRPNHRAPVAIVQVWYRVGSSYEYNGITGVSHVLEHLMFKGTHQRPSGEFEKILAENGAENNAFTSKDYTAYYELIASDRIAIALELEAERMRDLLLNESEFQRERNVVKEERRWRTEDKATALAYEQFIATAYMNSPYRSPVIGWMSDLNHLTLNDVRQWYQCWYAPNNATIVVVGDVQPLEVFKLVKRYFSHFEKSDIQAPKPQQETLHRGMRHSILKAPAQIPYLLMGYKVPSIKHAKETWEPYAFEVLASVLDGGDSARLSRELIRGSEVASSAFAQYSGYGRFDELFVLGGTPAKGYDVKDLRKAIESQLSIIKNEGISSEELQRIKAQVLAEEIYLRDSIAHQAYVIGSLESVGLDYRLADQYVQNIAKVTQKQVQEIAQKYFNDDALTMIELDPQPIDSKQSKRPTPFFIR